MSEPYPATTAALPVRTALVGLGRIGFGFHGPALRADTRFSLVGVVDPLPERRSEAEQLWSVPSFDRLEALLRELQPELVVLASPTPFHLEQAETAFLGGAHVFGEKPLATSATELERMIGAAARAQRKLVPYQPRRYAAEVQALRRILAAGILGQVHLIERARCNFERRRDWQAQRAHGGGLLNNYGSHCLDELLWILGGDAVERVTCQLRCVVTTGDAEDVVKALLETRSGCLVDLHISQAAALTDAPWRVFGSRGAIRWNEAARRWEGRYFREEDVPQPKLETGLAAEGRRYQTEALPWQELLENTAGTATFDYYDALWRHLRLDAPPPVTWEEARALQALIERCRRSAESGASA